MEENEILKLKKNLDDMKQRNLELCKRIKARDNIIKNYSTKYKDPAIQKEIDKMKRDDKNWVYGKNEGNASTIKEDKELIESLGQIIQQNENELKSMQNQLNQEKDNNKNKDKLIIEKENEIRNIKEKLEKEQKINLDKNQEIINLKKNLQSNEVEMKNLREQLELNKKEKNKTLDPEVLQNENKNYKDKLKEYEDKIKKLENEIENIKKIPKCETVHNGIKCKKCFQEPIIGYRYKCSVCNDYNLCQNCEEKNSISEEHQHDFIKIRKNLNNNIIDIKKYSYECINILQLSMYLYEGTEKGQCEIILKNNGAQAWPEGRTKLVFERESEIYDSEIILRPQKPGEIGKYNIIISQLGNYSHKQYKSYLCLYIDDEEVGDQLTLTINIKQKENNKKKIEDNRNKITEFRNNYNLGIEDYSDEILFEALEKNKYDYDAAFSSLFPDF